MSRAIKIMPAEYFFGSFIHLHGKDVVMFGDGYRVIVHLKQPISLKEHAE